MCDEAQFYNAVQVDQLARVVDELGADVHAFGLLTDFSGRLFDGTARCRTFPANRSLKVVR